MTLRHPDCSLKLGMTTAIHGKSILVIDDDAALVRALNKVLTGAGAIVTTAAYAGEAMEQLTDKLKLFDLIITDLRMPILGGQAIVGAVAVAQPKVPVIVISAFGNPEVKAQCLQNGAAAFLEKPLDTPQLLAAIERVLPAGEPGSPRHESRRGGAQNSVTLTPESLKNETFETH